MNIRTLFIINLLVIFSVAGLIIFSGLKYESFKNLNQTEIETLQDTNSQIIRTIQNETERLVTYTRNWARWDETFLFMQDGQDNTFIQTNLSQDTLADMEVVSMLFLTRAFQPYFSYTRNDKKDEARQIARQVLEKQDLLKQSIENGQNYVLLYEPGFKRFFWSAIVPVTPKKYHHISNGYMVISKIIDEQFIEKISLITGNQLEIRPETANQEMECLSETNLEQFCGKVFLRNEKTAQLDIAIRDSEHKTTLRLHTEVYRALNLQIQRVFRHTLLVIFATGVLVALLNLLLVQFLVVKPTGYLARGFTKLAKKRSLDRRLKVSGPAEIRRMTEAANTMLDEIKDLHQQVELLSRIDDLTGIYNRRYFDELFRREFRRSLREGHSMALLMLDIDFFKNFNDHYGHVAGDECLRQVANILRNCLQRAGDIVARYGGEEFIVMLSNTPMDGLNVIAQGIIEAITAAGIKHEYSAAAEHVSCSIGGVSIIPKFPGDAQKMLLQADELLYQAKERGRNQAVLSEILQQD